jgi:hypothetical protein
MRQSRRPRPARRGGRGALEASFRLVQKAGPKLVHLALIRADRGGSAQGESRVLYSASGWRVAAGSERRWHGSRSHICLRPAFFDCPRIPTSRCAARVSYTNSPGRRQGRQPGGDSVADGKTPSSRQVLS